MVSGSTTSTWSTLRELRLAERARHASGGARGEYLAASASNGSPSWNFTPGRSLMVTVLPSAEVSCDERELRHDVQLLVDVEQLVAERRRRRCGRHRCARASDRARRDPRRGRCAAWSGPGQTPRTKAAAPLRSLPNARFSLLPTPYPRVTPSPDPCRLISTPARSVPSAPPLKAATSFSSVGEKPPSTGTMLSGGGSSATRWHAVACPVPSGSSCGTSTRQRSIDVGAAGMKAAAGRRIERARHLALQHNAAALCPRFRHRDRRQQRPAIGMARRCEQRLGVRGLDDACRDSSRRPGRRCASPRRDRARRRCRRGQAGPAGRAAD